MSDRIDLLAVLPKAADLETHVRVLGFADRDVLEFVDFIPSLDHYGRGYWLPLHDPGVIAHLGRAMVQWAGE